MLWIVREPFDDLLGQPVFLLAQLRKAVLVVDDQLLWEKRRGIDGSVELPAQQAGLVYLVEGLVNPQALFQML